ncbi:MAG TPA: hypothetical protein VFX63_00485 [Pyrinomonadaceae bacterium]|nr:hypothetical protein [Pyrinomonadaceae bacterium]
MIRFLAIATLVISTGLVSGGKPQESEGVVARLPGKSLKWIHIAERVFVRKGINVDNWTVVVFDEEDTITVYLRDPNQPSTTRGGGGLNVEISKKTKKVTRTYYSR